MRSVRSVAICASVGMLAVTCIAAPPAKRHAAPFTLTISTKKETVRAQKDSGISLTVKEKNISRRAIDLTKNDMYTGHWYRVDISRDGRPVAKTREMLRHEEPPTDGEITTNGPFFLTLRPGKDAETDFRMSDYYDMTEPGAYEITLTEEADPFNTRKIMVVQSNTIKITVVPAEAQ